MLPDYHGNGRYYKRAYRRESSTYTSPLFSTRTNDDKLHRNHVDMGWICLKALCKIRVRGTIQV